MPHATTDDALRAALSEAADDLRIPASLQITYKGVGRSSGDAPRAVKAIMLNRLIAHYGRDAVTHVGGDTYSVQGRCVTFRVTTSAHRTSFPWFNVSSREVAEWTKSNTAVIVVGTYPLAKRNHFTGIMLLLRPDLFGDLEASPTKASERQPTALFEVKYERPGGLLLINASARGTVPPLKVPENAWGKFDLSRQEARFLGQAYDLKREPDPTSGGRFKPLTLLVDPGEASNEELAELLSEISKLYRMVGGSGINFKLTDARRPVEVAV